jgi:hypothetical protein
MMNSCEIRVVGPRGRDESALALTLQGFGHVVSERSAATPPQHEDEIIVVDARDACVAELAEIERDLSEQPGPIVVISDNLGLNFGSLSNQVGRSVVLASSGSEMGYKVALKLCELMIEDRAAALAAA